ncbi:MAG TPA: hypothetical protein VNN77_16215 [candidate division Zixibacteria bacterium]|nr:hypothetical protein [candidate division Zixibacteria bacterium]
MELVTERVRENEQRRPERPKPRGRSMASPHGAREEHGEDEILEGVAGLARDKMSGRNLASIDPRKAALEQELEESEGLRPGKGVRGEEKDRRRPGDYRRPVRDEIASSGRPAAIGEDQACPPGFFSSA